MHMYMQCVLDSMALSVKHVVRLTRAQVPNETTHLSLKMAALGLVLCYIESLNVHVQYYYMCVYIACIIDGMCRCM